MRRFINPNIEILEIAVSKLDDLVERLVFLGGCATGLLITDKAAPPIRSTHDVDVITEVATLAEYYHLADQLRQHGFLEDSSEDAPICRWKGDSPSGCHADKSRFARFWQSVVSGGAEIGNMAQSTLGEKHPHDHFSLFSGLQICRF